jgi:hypothetical protein
MTIKILTTILADLNNLLKGSSTTARGRLDISKKLN